MRGLIMQTPRLTRLLPGLVALAALTLSFSLDAKPAPAAVAAADPNETCLMCHADPAAKSEGGKSIAVDAKVFAGSVHGQMQLKCTDCHSDVSAEKLPHAPKLKPANCATCHEEPVKEYLSTAHAKARAGGNMVAATCTDCHGKHDIQKSTEPASRTNLANREATCGACHGNDAVVKKANLPGGNIVAQYHDSIHGKKTNGKTADAAKAPTCTGCHGSHRILGKSDAKSRVNRENIAGMCGSCHQQVFSRFTASMHGQMRQAGNSAAPTCIDCHSAHSIQQHNTPQWQVDVINECGNCHGGLLTTYRDTYHGQVTKLGFTRVATCNSCHGAHEVLPASNPRSAISPENRVNTCRSCHPGANANFAAYKPHGNPRDRKGEPLLYYTRLFMVWLLIGVFSFFGLHTLLWLLRSLKEVREHRAGRGGH
jgi:nitrate/TMAO reductase-like tetraheme cytochrome c subunit